MKTIQSRAGKLLAATAVLAMTASPVFARGHGGWGHRDRDRIDAGDVFAGILVIGGIAAIASAAGSAKKKRESEGDYREREGEYRPDYRSESGRYGNERDNRDWRGSSTSSWQGAGTLNTAVDNCVSEVERGDRQVYSVDNASRNDEGWRIEGRTSTGRGFSCVIDRDGRTRQVSVDGQAI